MKIRSLLIVGLLIALLLSGCTLKLSKAAPTLAPTAVLTPPVPDLDSTPATIITVTSEGAQPSPTPQIEVVQPTQAPTQAPAVPTTAPTVAPTAAPTQPAVSAPTATPAAVTSTYPVSAEEVVKAFLASYPDDPDEMKSYLSSGLLANLPDGKPGAAAQLNGTLDSFVIQSGAASTNPPYAVVQVELKLNGVTTVRIFQLIVESGQWKINFVDIARG